MSDRRPGLLRASWDKLRELWLMPPNVEAARLNGDLPSLAAALRYPAYRTRCEAAWALAEEGEDGVAVLRRALTDPEPRVRASAADGLGEVDWDTVDANVRAVAVARLRVASRDPVESVRMAASAALGRMDAEDEPDPWAEIDEDEETPPDPLAHLRSDDAADDVRLAWLATHPRTPELPAATGASAAPTPARKTMAVCPRCQRLCKPEWVRCHHGGAKMTQSQASDGRPSGAPFSIPELSEAPERLTAER